MTKENDEKLAEEIRLTVRQFNYLMIRARQLGLFPNVSLSKAEFGNPYLMVRIYKEVGDDV